MISVIDLSWVTDVARGTLMVELRGELDYHTKPILWVGLGWLLVQPDTPSTIWLDASGVTFVEVSTGLWTLLRLSALAQAHGRELKVAVWPEGMIRIFRHLEGAQSLLSRPLRRELQLLNVELES